MQHEQCPARDNLDEELWRGPIAMGAQWGAAIAWSRDKRLVSMCAMHAHAGTASNFVMYSECAHWQTMHTMHA